MVAAVATFTAADPGDRGRRLPLALVASTLLHAAIGIGLALWLVPGQQSSLPPGDAPLAVTIRQVDAPPAAVSPPGTPEPGAKPETRTALTAATASATLLQQGSVVAPVAAPTAEPRDSSPVAPSGVAGATSTPSLPAAKTGTVNAPPAPAVATGTATLAIDSAIPANVAFAALARSASGMEFPVEVSKPVHIRSAPAVTYPSGALARQQEGSVLAVVIVDERGMPYSISLLEFDKAFVESAETAIKETRFTPAEDMNGKPIMFHTMVRIRFVRTTPGNAGPGR